MKKLSGILLLTLSVYLSALADNSSVLINEIAWMGTESSYNNEWIELYNPTEEAIDLTGWVLKDTGDKLMINLEGQIEPQGFYVMERTDEETLPDVEAQLIYTGALKNTDIGLILFDAEGTEIDKVSSWHAGDNTKKLTMQRKPDDLSLDLAEAWCTHAATPGQMNTCPEETIEPEPKETPEEEPPAEEIPEAEPTQEINEASVLLELEIEEVIAEEEVELKEYPEEAITFDRVMPNPDGPDKGQEWIELKNNTAEVINLKAWQIIDAKPTEYTFDFWELSPDEIIKIYQTEFKLNLNNSLDELILRDPMGNIIDRIDWKNAQSNQKIFQTKYLTDGVPGKAVRIIDGDTFVAMVNDQELKIRLIGVDTPETVHPRKGMEWYGKRASLFLENALINQDIVLDFEEKKMDKYGRLLAYVFVENTFINAEILKGGYGHAYTRFPFKYKDLFVTLEREAKEKKVGMWESKTTKALVALEKEKDRYNTDILIDASSDLALESQSDETETPEKEDAEVKILAKESDKKEIHCLHKNLKIEAILPNSTKGLTTEYIRLKNIGKEKACLEGWSLDDQKEKGSKPFIISGGAIHPNGVRTFRKEETKINLNNTNDCAYLIDPLGEIIDHICYSKTHKNEIFTHEGGNYIEPTKQKMTTKKVSSISKKKSIKPQDFDLYQNLGDTTVKALISHINPVTQTVEIQMIQEQSTTLSYADSDLNMELIRNLIHTDKPVEITLRSGHDEHQILEITQDNMTEKSASPPTQQITYGFLLLTSSLSLLGLKFIV